MFGIDIVRMGIAQSAAQATDKDYLPYDQGWSKAITCHAGVQPDAIFVIITPDTAKNVYFPFRPRQTQVMPGKMPLLFENAFSIGVSIHAGCQGLVILRLHDRVRSRIDGDFDKIDPARQVDARDLQPDVLLDLKYLGGIRHIMRLFARFVDATV